MTVMAMAMLLWREGSQHPTRTRYQVLTSQSYPLLPTPLVSSSIVCSPVFSRLLSSCLGVSCLVRLVVDLDIPAYPNLADPLEGRWSRIS